MKEVKKGTIRVKIRKGDAVVFITGKEYNRFDANGKRNPTRGEVIEVDPRNAKIKVGGANIVKKHQKPVPQMNIEGGIKEKEAWVNISNVALIDPETGKPTRIKYEVRDGKKVRVAKSGKVIGVTAKAEPTEVAKTEKKKATKKTDDKSE